MVKLQWLNSLSKEAICNLVGSIDTVLFDIDGVLVYDKSILPGSVEAVKKLRALGKKIGFVTNNSINSLEYIQNNLKYFEAKQEEILTPNLALLEYLRKTDFNKDIYQIGSTIQKKLLNVAGYNVINFKDIKTNPIEETIGAVKQTSLEALEMCKNVELVHLDLDFNCSYGALQVAQVILSNNQNAKLSSGVSDESGPAGNGINLLGTKFYIEVIERLTKRKSIKMGKPSEYLIDVLLTQFQITDPNRVLMVGDNPYSDIVFGVKAGFKTFLVLSGIWTKDQTENWKEPEQFAPDYVGASLGELYENIKDMSKTCLLFIKYIRDLLIYLKFQNSN